MTTRCRRSARCSAAISSGSAVSGVYTRPGKNGNFSGSPWMWVWQSQAPAGTSKFTGVAGWEALAKPVRRRMAAPAAIAPIRTSRRVSMEFSFGGILSVARRFRYFSLNPNAAFGQVPGDGSRFQASPGEPDVAVRTQQIESRPRDPHAGELLRVVRLVGDHVDAQKIAESQRFPRGRGLPDDDQVVARVV